MGVDPTNTPEGVAICAAISQRVEIEFAIGGAPVVMQPHILYETYSGTQNLAGIRPDGTLVEVPATQLHNVVVTTRSFKVNPAFDWKDARYHQVFAMVI